MFSISFQEQLFVSKRSVFDGKKPIRGGIPFVFPVFGSSTILPQHGFARIVRWQLEKGPDRLHTGDIEAIFSLSDSGMSDPAADTLRDHKDRWSTWVFSAPAFGAYVRGRG